MESTGKYWITFGILERNIVRLSLLIPNMFKGYPWKKTDRKILKWIADLFKRDLVAGSFMPPPLTSASSRLTLHALPFSNDLFSIKRKESLQNISTVSNIQLRTLFRTPNLGKICSGRHWIELLENADTSLTLNPLFTKFENFLNSVTLLAIYITPEQVGKQGDQSHYENGIRKAEAGYILALAAPYRERRSQTAPGIRSLLHHRNYLEIRYQHGAFPSAEKLPNNSWARSYSNQQ